MMKIKRREKILFIIVVAILISGCVDVYQEEVATTSTITTTSTTSSTTSTSTSSSTTTLITYPMEIEFETLLRDYHCAEAPNQAPDLRASDLQYVIDNETALRGAFPDIDYSNNTVIAVYWLRVANGKGLIEISKILEYENRVIVLSDKGLPYPTHRRWRRHQCYIVKTKKIKKPVVFIEYKKYCTCDRDCVIGAQELYSYNLPQWCNPDDCINEERYGVQERKYGNQTDCKIEYTSIVCGCVNNSCQQTTTHPSVEIVRETDESFYCENDSDCVPRPGFWNLCINDSLVKSYTWGSCRGCRCPKVQSCYCINNACVGEKRTQCDQGEYISFRENESIPRTFYM